MESEKKCCGKRDEPNLEQNNHHFQAENRRLNFGGGQTHLPRSQVGSGSWKAPLSATNGVLGAHRAGNASAFVGTSAAWRGKVGPQKSLVRCRGSITPFWVFP